MNVVIRPACAKKYNSKLLMNAVIRPACVKNYN